MVRSKGLHMLVLTIEASYFNMFFFEIYCIACHDRPLMRVQSRVTTSVSASDGA
jgi:hypothetical protein